MSSPTLSILFRKEEESWNALAARVRATQGEVLLVLPSAESQQPSAAEREVFLNALAKIRYRVKIATKHPTLLRAARGRGFSVINRTQVLRRVLRGHARAEETVRLFSPQLLRQFWRSRLQTMGLLSLPKVRIWILILVSGILFFFVLFRLLPSAEIRVRPRQDTITQTTNLFLSSSGAITAVPGKVSVLSLVPLTVHVRRSLTFDQISVEFTGTNADVEMTVRNGTGEPISLRKGTRFVNQAGMAFRSRSALRVPAHGTGTVRATADALDMYGETIGERGNVPAGVPWRLPGLPEDLREVVVGTNRAAARGGKTSSRKVLSPKDLQNARLRLEHELLALAKQRIEEELNLWNATHAGQQFEFLTQEDVIRSEFTDFVLPTQFIGHSVESVPVEGSLTYTMFAYDAEGIARQLAEELQSHIVEGKRLLQESVHADRLKVYVIGFADDLTWIKITADLAATEEFILDPLTPSGIRFSRLLREKVAGVSKSEALRIIKNLPEVESADIGVWPPWSSRLPLIPSHITVAAP